MPQKTAVDGSGGLYYNTERGELLAKKSGRNTKSKIVSAAWKLFYDQGYDATTVEEIIFESGTSKGSFYHYFDGKDALLGTLADLFDQKYESLEPSLDVNGDCVEQLLFLNRACQAALCHPADRQGRKTASRPQPSLLPPAAKAGACGAKVGSADR